MGTKSSIERQLISDRNTLSQLAETGWEEYKSRDYIRNNLPGTPVFEDKTALVYKVGQGEISLFFRAELDALPTPEGPKHVCGHSSHAAVLMAVYRYVYENPVKNISIYFVFQPCEEGYPSGAKFISDAFLPLRDCKLGIAFHSFPSEKPGELLNPHMASGDYFEIKMKGTSSHVKNKYTQQSTDVLVTAARLVEKLNTSHFDSALVNIGVMKGGETSNSLAGEAMLTGDVRAMNENSRLTVKQFVYDTVSSIQEDINGVHIQLSYFDGYPVLLNNKKILKKAKTFLPIGDTVSTFATEDFSLYPVPQLFLLFGTGREEELHELSFYVPEELLSVLYEYWMKIVNNLQLFI